MKSILICGLAIVGMTLVSCNKDWKCDCSYELLGETIEETHEFNNMTKDDAESNCTLNVPGVETFECNLESK